MTDKNHKASDKTLSDAVELVADDVGADAKSHDDHPSLPDSQGNHGAGNAKKGAFVSPRRIATVDPSSSSTHTTVSPNRTSPSRAKGKRTSPKKTFVRPCKDHSAQSVAADGSDDVALDSYTHKTDIQTPAAVNLTPGTVRRRANWQARSQSSDSSPGVTNAESSYSSAVNKSFDYQSSGRVRSLSPDGRACSSPARDENTKRHKRTMILKALDTATPDVTTIRQLAISRGGLLENSLRQRAWPVLLDVDINNIKPKPDVEVLHRHRDYQQVLLDVNRSSKRFPPGMLEEIRLTYQDQLIECIMWILVYHDELHYYQGFHDVVVTFLLVIGEELTFAVMDKLVEDHFRDFMDASMEKTNYMLHYMLPIIGKASPPLRSYLEKSEVGAVFCLSWLITWYGHVLSDFKDIVRLYDFFIACHPLMPIYLAADIVLYREREVMACECEMPFVHGLLSRIPDDLPFELLITRAGDLFIQYPPNSLEEEARSQYEMFVHAMEQRREEAAAQRERLKSGRVSSRLPPGRVSNHKMNFFVKVTVWTLVGAFSAIAFTLYKSNMLLDWRSWLWA